MASQRRGSNSFIHLFKPNPKVPIEAFDKKGPAINAIITTNSDALKEAARLDAAYKASGPVGPLHGIPVIVKDQADVKGMPTTLGSVLFKDYYLTAILSSQKI
jgi:Asp-tRNA(Asn)/Glu-tRNA(Gln) amidotransferase A subunit family amidase